MRISDWSSDVCSSYLVDFARQQYLALLVAQHDDDVVRLLDGFLQGEQVAVAPAPRFRGEDVERGGQAPRVQPGNEDAAARLQRGEDLCAAGSGGAAVAAYVVDAHRLALGEGLRQPLAEVRDSKVVRCRRQIDRKSTR